MDVRDAVESDAEVIATLADAPVDAMRAIVHDRTVRVLAVDDDVAGFVSFDVQDGDVCITQLGGTQAACERLLAEPIRFAEREGMAVRVTVPASEEMTRSAAERVGFTEVGTGPRFDGERTVTYRLDSDDWDADAV